jgi:hypothetical protein
MILESFASSTPRTRGLFAPGIRSVKGGKTVLNCHN